MMKSEVRFFVGIGMFIVFLILMAVFSGGGLRIYYAALAGGVGTAWALCLKEAWGG